MKRLGQLTVQGAVTWLTALAAWAVLSPLRAELYDLGIAQFGAGSVTGIIVLLIEPVGWLGIIGSFFVWVMPVRQQQQQQY